MEQTVSMTCPHCGGKLQFNKESKLVTCDNCSTSFAPYRLLKYDIDDAEDVSFGVEKSEENDHLTVNVCQSCGAEIMLLDNIAASECPFCGNSILVKKSLTGDYRPKYVIPFQISDDQMKKKLHSYLAKKYYLPSSYKKALLASKINPIYAPYFIYGGDVTAKMEFIMNTSGNGDGQNVGLAAGTILAFMTLVATQGHFGDEFITSFSRSDYKTENALINLNAKLSFHHLGISASSELDRNLLTLIEPFNAKEIRPFNSTYLAGYQAKKYDSPLEDVEDTAKAIFSLGMERELDKQYGELTHHTLKVHDIKLRKISANYALYPIYVSNFKWEDKDYQMVMNAQTGKVAMKLPISKKRVVFAVILNIIFATLLFFGLTYIFWHLFGYMIPAMIVSALAALFSLTFVPYSVYDSTISGKDIDTSVYVVENSLTVSRKKSKDEFRKDPIGYYKGKNYKPMLNRFQKNNTVPTDYEEAPFVMAYLKECIKKEEAELNVFKKRLQIGAIDKKEYDLRTNRLIKDLENERYDLNEFTKYMNQKKIDE